MSCPICHGATYFKLSLSFGHKEGLPPTINLRECVTCDFAFTEPRNTDYGKYYANNINSHIDVSAGQIEILKPFVSAKSCVLDIGCGNGELIERLSPFIAEGRGVDFSVEKKSEGNIHFSKNTNLMFWQQFNFIIMSHVLEHVVDLDIFLRCTELLNDDGLLYIEVPDVSRYADYLRREYLYYIDRLHVNHFTHKSLSKLMDKFGFMAVQLGQRDIEYKDGLYPAFYMVFKKRQEWLDKYIELEKKKVLGIPLDQEIVVYGGGDNFWRWRRNGPLHDYTIAAIVDRNGGFGSTEEDIAVEKYSQLPWLVTVSWGAEEVRDRLLAKGVKQVALI